MDLTVEDRGAAESNGPVRIAFSSEEPYERHFGIEVLDHAAESVDLSRLNNGAPVLVEHDRRSHIGTIIRGTASIDADKRGRAAIRFASDDEGARVRQRVIDGILTKVSVGYEVLKMRLESEGAPATAGDDPVRTYRVTKWRPFEVSLVSLAADDSVGVGRALEDLDMGKSNDTTAPAPDTDATTRASVTERSLDEVRAKAVAENNTRIVQILKIAERHKGSIKIEKAARAAISDGMEWPQFAQKVMFELTSDEAPAPARPPTALDLSDNDRKSYSLLRALRAIVLGRAQGLEFGRLAPFEAECSREIAERLDREPRGMFVPFDIQNHGEWTLGADARRRAYEAGLTLRAPPMSVGLASTEGASLVGTDHLASAFIEALRPTTVVIAAGATVLDGLVGNVDIPKQSGRAAFVWELEDGDSNDTEVADATVTLSPKTVSGSVPITRRLLKQSSPSVEAIVRNDLVLGAGEALDVGALTGNGTGAIPLGILNQTGINTVTIATPGSPTWPEMVKFETECATDNALRSDAVYVMTPAVRGAGKSISKDTGSGMMLIEGNAANGYGVRATTHLATHGILFGSFSQCLIGMWGVVDINVDTATKAASGGLVLRAFLDADIAVRHAQAFAKNA